ncbi:MAG: leucine-rich repeat protein, partial [Oscillospiraceae bacterium]|nr:leucine-rich repeat protein [Oscillospiraceae bacterium]
MNVVVTYDQVASSPHWIVVAYYGEHEYDTVTSNEFTIRLTGHSFTTQPADCSIEPDGVVPVQWATDFVPTKVQLGYATSSSTFFPVVTITSGLGKTMGTFLDYNTACQGNSTWCIAAWYDEGKVEFSNNFTITRTNRAFLQSPEGGELSPGETMMLNWETNFEPTKIEIGWVSSWDNSFNVVDTLTEGLSTSMSYELSYTQLSTLYSTNNLMIKAYHDGPGLVNYASSAQFRVDRVSPKFLSYPDSPQRINTGGYVRLDWETNFVPVQVVIQAKDWSTGDYYDVVTISTNLGKKMYRNLNDSAISHAAYLRVVAYYNYLTPVYSYQEIQLTRVAADRCGDNLTWTLDDNGVLTISGTGPMWDFNQGTAPWYGRRGEVKKVVISDGATSIGKFAFYACPFLTQATIPASVTACSQYTFLSCGNLNWVYYDGFLSQWEQIDIPASNYELLQANRGYLYRSGNISGTDVCWALDGATGRLSISGSGGSGIHVTAPWQQWGEWIEEIEIQEGIDTVWEEAFRDCTNVTTVKLPGGLAEVELNAFGSCTALEDVYYNNLQAKWNSLVYNHIASGNDPLLNATLRTAAQVQQLTADLSWSLDDDGLLRIYVDESLGGSGEELDIPDYTTSNFPPYYSGSVKTVRIESGVTGIGNRAFAQLPNLSSVEISDTVTTIGNYAFSDDSRLTAIILPNGISSIGTGAFRNSGLVEIRLPDSVTSIGAQAFNNCRKLERVWLSNQLSSIPSACFDSCTSLCMVSIPVSVTSINNTAFNSCSALRAEGGAVYYGGTSAQWAAINLTGASATYLRGAWEVHFNPEELAVNERNFPDAQFRTYVSEHFDTDGSGYLNAAEIAAATTINDEDNDYGGFQGIEYLTELNVFVIDTAPSLTSVDLRTNIGLLTVNINDCDNLSELCVDGLTWLQYLYAGNNALTELDLGGLPALKVLSVSDNPIAQLDLSGLSKLTMLYVTGTELTELDLSGLSALYRLSCYDTEIEVLDISACPLLCEVLQTGTRTIQTDGSGRSYVQYRIGSTDHVLAVDPTTIVYTGAEGLPIDAEHFPDPIFRLYVYNSFDADRSGTLSDAERLAVTAIDVDCMGVASLQGVQYFNQLESLYCNDNDLAELDLSENLALTQLYCYENQLTALDLSANTALTYVDCDDNPDLETLNLSGLTHLGYLDVSGCNLSSLDLSSGTELTYLECDSNALTSLILGEQPALATLICYANDLTELDISGCPILVDAWVNGTHEVQSWGLAVSGGTLGGYMELDKDQTVIASAEPDYIPGDINGDCNVDGTDVVLLATYVKASGSGVTIVPGSGDVNGDGRV